VGGLPLTVRAPFAKKHCLSSGKRRKATPSAFFSRRIPTDTLRMATQERASTPKTSPPPAARDLSFRRLWQLPVFLLGLMALLGVWMTHSLWNDPAARRFERSLLAARETLLDPKAPLNELPMLLSEALEQIDRFPGRAGEVHFLLGSVYLRLGDKVSPAERAVKLCQQALTELEQAQALGLPEPDRGAMAYRMGKALYQTGGEPHKVVFYLSGSVDQAGEDRFEGYQMLTKAYLALQNSKAALDANERALQQPFVDERRLAPVRLLRGELLWKEDRAGARKALERIGSDAPPTTLARVRFLIALSHQDDQAWSKAAECWRQILADRREPAAPRPQILFYLGWCQHQLQHLEDAAGIWQQLQSGNGEEAQAAALRLAQLRLEKGQRADAVKLLARALAAVTKPEEYQNRLMTLQQTRELFESASRACLQGGAFDDSLKVVDLYRRIGSPEQVLLLRAQVLEAWAQADGKASGVDERSQVRRQEAARAHALEAAATWESAAEAAADDKLKAQQLWHASQDYFQAQDFTRAVRVLDRFMRLKPPGEQLSEASYRMGEAYQALNDVRHAEEAYRACIGLEKTEPVPKTRRFEYRARYQLALVEVGRGGRDEAAYMLRQNLELMGLAPDPESQERSLFLLAELLYMDGRYTQAASYWDQALTAYPTNVDRALARFHLGECYHHQAEAELQALRNSILAEMARSSRRHYRILLEKAAANYDKVKMDLDEAQRTGALLTQTEQTVLQQAAFALAQCRYYLGDYHEAVALYHRLANENMGKVEGLLALQQLWACYYAQPDRGQAAATLTRMRLFLEAVDDKLFANRPDSQSKKAFKTWIDKSEEETQKLSVVP